MSVDKQKRLVETLLKRSERGELDWKPAVSENSFQLTIKENTVRILEDEGARSTNYLIEILNSEGMTVERFSDAELDGEDPFNLESKIKMRRLYNMARRTALGSDKVLTDVLSSLGDS